MGLRVINGRRQGVTVDPVPTDGQVAAPVWRARAVWHGRWQKCGGTHEDGQDNASLAMRECGCASLSRRH
jgi:hypothetical protein